MRSKIKTYLVASPFVVIIYYVFFSYAPWVLSNKPIANIDNYELSNLPPPDGAVSFAINHGAAIYYYEKTQLELVVVSLALFISIVVVAVLLGKAHRNET